MIDLHLKNLKDQLQDILKDTLVIITEKYFEDVLKERSCEIGKGFKLIENKTTLLIDPDNQTIFTFEDKIEAIIHLAKLVRDKHIENLQN